MKDGFQMKHTNLGMFSTTSVTPPSSLPTSAASTPPISSRSSGSGSHHSSWSSTSDLTQSNDDYASLSLTTTQLSKQIVSGGLRFSLRDPLSYGLWSSQSRSSSPRMNSSKSRHHKSSSSNSNSNNGNGQPNLDVPSTSVASKIGLKSLSSYERNVIHSFLGLHQNKSLLSLANRVSVCIVYAIHPSIIKPIDGMPDLVNVPKEYFQEFSLPTKEGRYKLRSDYILGAYSFHDKIPTDMEEMKYQSLTSSLTSSLQFLQKPTSSSSSSSTKSTSPRNAPPTTSHETTKIPSLFETAGVMGTLHSPPSTPPQKLTPLFPSSGSDPTSVRSGTRSLSNPIQYLEEEDDDDEDDDEDVDGC